MRRPFLPLAVLGLALALLGLSNRVEADEILFPGDTASVHFTYRNTSGHPLTVCMLLTGSREWFISQLGPNDVNAGDSAVYYADVVVPDSACAGPYILGFLARCDTSFVVTVGQYDVQSLVRVAGSSVDVGRFRLEWTWNPTAGPMPYGVAVVRVDGAGARSRLSPTVLGDRVVLEDAAVAGDVGYAYYVEVPRGARSVLVGRTELRWASTPTDELRWMSSARASGGLLSATMLSSSVRDVTCELFGVDGRRLAVQRLARAVGVVEVVLPYSCAGNTIGFLSASSGGLRSTRKVFLDR